MNCQLGDLAVVNKVVTLEGKFIGVPVTYAVDIKPGTIVKIVRILSDDSGNAIWGFEEPIRGVTFSSEGRHPFQADVTGLADHFLKPIRGEEGEDETLSWKEIPSGILIKTPSDLVTA